MKEINQGQLDMDGYNSICRISEELWKIEHSNLEKQVAPNVATLVGQKHI